MIRFAILGSGSKGNGTLVECDGTRVLIDCGFFLREAESRLRRFGVDPASLSAILVTHEHADHIGGVARLARKHQVPVWMTHGTCAAWDDPVVPRLHRFSPHETFSIGALSIEPFPVPHDAREPCHYVFGDGSRRLGVLSDAGHVTPHMRSMLTECDALLVEFNHDPQMLIRGPYPPPLKARVGGLVGHLSNGQAAQLVAAVNRARLQHLVLTHLSEVNNTPALARASAVEAMQCDQPWIVCAHQEQGLSWREVL